MIEDILGGVIKFIVHVVGYFFIELIFELLIKAPGYYICKQFTRWEPDPDGVLVIVVGLLFWITLGIGTYVLYSNFGGA